jgi:tRNA nucleotidyltransferase (CCA-adding enzyme)
MSSSWITAVEGPLASSPITHADIANFAADEINLSREDAAEFREQVGRLRDKLDAYACDHPTFGLIKTLLSGSLAKGTSLKVLNDIDVAFYVSAGKSPSAERELLDWLAQRIRDAYPQMRSDQVTSNDHSVCVKFAVSRLNVDVVPIRYNGGTDDQGYLFGGDFANPVLTSIPLHLAFIRKRKAQQKNDFAQMVRLVKWWVYQQKKKDPEFKLKSFMSELLIAHLTDNGLSLADYTIALEKFFSFIVKSQLRDI